jgi:activating signal cointegrator 1
VAVKALTLWPPWGTLVALGLKRLETRSWRSLGPFPFRLAIHQAKAWTSAGRSLTRDPRVAIMLGENGFPTPADLPLGCVVCLCSVTGCLPAAEAARKLDGPELLLGDFRPGLWAWVLEALTPLDRPVPARGRQQLWEWDGDGLPEALRGVRQAELPFPLT